ncbi:MAG: hypothetical protein IKK08_10610 [Clostridia bacterium]|nr:hypothetical protein [Clostridia bacterium]
MNERKKILINNLSVPFYSEDEESYSPVYDIRIQRFTPIIFRIEEYKLYFDCDMSHYIITYNQFGKKGESTNTLFGANFTTESSIDYYVPGMEQSSFSKQVLYYDIWRDGILNLTVLMPVDNTIIIQFSFTEQQCDNWGWDNFSTRTCQVSLEFFD